MIEVSVKPAYLPERSSLERAFFAYWVKIANHSDRTVQLMERYWSITEAEGEKNEVNGEGVIGVQPIIAAGQSFEYNSFVLIEHLPAMMSGYYTFRYLDTPPTASQEPLLRFQVDIEPFALRIPANGHAQILN